MNGKGLNVKGIGSTTPLTKPSPEDEDGELEDQQKEEEDDPLQMPVVRFVHQDIVDKIRSKFNCCLVDYLLLCFCAKRK